MLEVKNLTFNYNRRGLPTIDDFSLRIEHGGVYGLLGSNGAGKTTLFQLIGGLLTPQSGEVLYDGVNTRRRLPSTLSDICMVPEEVYFPSIKLVDYVKMAGAMYPKFSIEDFNSHLALYEMPSDVNLGKLSMGQRKKVALAFAMACNTGLVLLDEPTNGLDIPSKSAFRKSIATSIGDDRVCIISTHQVRDVTNLLDYVLIINNRRVLLDAPLYRIQERMKFVDTVSPEVIARAVYSEPGLGGASVILPNDDGRETTVNLELLFNFAITNEHKLSTLINS